MVSAPRRRQRNKLRDMVTLLVRISARQSTSAIYDTPVAATREPSQIAQHHRPHEHRDAAPAVAGSGRPTALSTQSSHHDRLLSGH